MDNIKAVKHRLILVCNKLEEDEDFREFKMGVSRTHKRMQKGGKPGKYRENLWIWLANKNLYYSLKNKGFQTPQVLLPQMQISLFIGGLTTAEIWFEKKALNNWRNKLISNLVSDPIENRKIEFYVRQDEKGSVMDELSNRKTTDDFAKLLEVNHNISAGFGIFYTKSEILKKNNLYLLIKRDLLQLIKNYYKPLIGKSWKGKGLLPPKNLRTRKESNIKTIKKIYRKGSEGGVINQLHKKMQNKYSEHLINIYGKTKVKTEEQFIDIRLN